MGNDTMVWFLRARRWALQEQEVPMEPDTEAGAAGRIRQRRPGLW